ncbi:hypothetical protein Btru_033919 [Bulinus truncatus]|nr:hypothetical protein Btru_033919 [Bulinus truncatus]
MILSNFPNNVKQKESGQCSQRNFNKEFQNLIQSTNELCTSLRKPVTTKNQTQDEVNNKIEAHASNDALKDDEVFKELQQNSLLPARKVFLDFHEFDKVDILQQAVIVDSESSSSSSINEQVCKLNFNSIHSSLSVFNSSQLHIMSRNYINSYITLRGCYQSHLGTKLIIFLCLVILIYIARHTDITSKHPDLIERNRFYLIDGLMKIESVVKYVDLLSIIKLSSHDKYQTDIWNLDSEHFSLTDKLFYQHNIVTSNRDFFAYPVFDMSRLASYRRQLSSFTSPVSFLQLSEAGFRYSGEGNIVVCDSCKNSVDLMLIEKNPNSSKYHHHGCENVAPLETDLAQSSSSNEIPSNSEIQIPGETLIQSETDVIETLNCDLNHYWWTPSPQDFIHEQCFETESSKEEEDENANECVKSHNHKDFRKINLLSFNDLPDELHEENLLNLVKIFGDLTVKVENKEKRVIGSGYIFNYPCKVISTKTLQQWPYLSKKNVELFQTFPEVGIVYVQTTSHLVHYDEEYPNTIVKFSSGKDFSLKGEVILRHKKQGVYQSIIVCFTPDVKIIENINARLQELADSARKLPDKVKEYMSDRVIIVSYPHGQDKTVSFGKSTSSMYGIKTFEEGRHARLYPLHFNTLATASSVEHVRMALTYDAPTCPGSSGAPVVTFKQSSTSKMEMDVWTHNGTLSSNNLLGVSVLKELDIPTVRSFSATPSYPTYYSFEKRLESLQNWSFTHIITPEVMAMAGFFYAGYADCVRCFQCGLGLRSWKIGDDIYIEHTRYRPTCPFLQFQLQSRALMENTEVNESDLRSSSHSSENNFTSPVMAQQIDSHPDNPSNHSTVNVANPTSIKQVELNQRNMIKDAKTLVNSAHYAASKEIAVKLLQKENTMLRQLLKCKVCKEAPIKELFLPCGHLYACSECSKQLI